MSTSLEFQNFFRDVATKQVDDERLWKTYVYVALTQWHWSYDEIMNTPCHFALEALNIYADFKEEEKKELEKNRRK